MPYRINVQVAIQKVLSFRIYQKITKRKEDKRKNIIRYVTLEEQHNLLNHLSDDTDVFELTVEHQSLNKKLHINY